MKTWIILGPCLTSVVACGASHPPEVRPPSAVPAARPAEAMREAESPSRGVVHIADEIRKACGIADADAHFAFDSSSLEESERPVLKQLAACFVSGPLKGREMRLVGHADPRGGDDYNMVLGGSRADTVKAFLAMRGVPTERMATTSRGELDARGTDEASWLQDRRVDVLLR